MTIYLNSQTTPNDIRLAQDSGLLAAKLYPAGATTNSEAGVKSITNLYPIFAEMEALKMILLVHGEVTTKEVDIFDREKIFIEEYLIKITQKFPKLKVVFEHITTKDAVDFVKESSNHVAATMTPQHLLLNRNDLFSGGIKPHNYCLPILKRGVHQEALKKAASSGSNKFFLGTDSAPHEKTEKESACGCAGCYTAPVAIELYTQIFEELNALDKLEGFASHFGADFYGLPRNNETITLVKENWVVPDQFTISNKKCVVPFWAGKTIHWRLK